MVVHLPQSGTSHCLQLFMGSSLKLVPITQPTHPTIASHGQPWPFSLPHSKLLLPTLSYPGSAFSAKVNPSSATAGGWGRVGVCHVSKPPPTYLIYPMTSHTFPCVPTHSFILQLTHSPIHSYSPFIHHLFIY